MLYQIINLNFENTAASSNLIFTPRHTMNNNKSTKK